MLNTIQKLPYGSLQITLCNVPTLQITVPHRYIILLSGALSGIQGLLRALCLGITLGGLGRPYIYMPKSILPTTIALFPEMNLVHVVSQG